MFKRTDIVYSIVSGALLILSFPPFEFYPLAWFALIPLFIALKDKGMKASFYTGGITGFTFFSGTLYWVFHSIYHYSAIPAVFAVLLVFILSLFLSIYFGLFSMLFSAISERSRMPAVFTASVLWVTFEVARSYAVTGFPWLLLGYSQYKFLSLIQVSDITGVYGISFLTAGFNGAIFDVIFLWPGKLNKMPLLGRSHLTAGLVIYFAILIFSLSYGLLKLNSSYNGPQKIKASVIQGNIPQDIKWNDDAMKNIIQTYKSLSLDAASGSPGLIVWPEAALPFVFSKEDALSKDILDFQKSTGAYLITGAVTRKEGAEGGTLYANSAIMISSAGEAVSVYDKIHLVPFGEYVPLGPFFPFIKKLVVAAGDFMPGEENTVMEMPGAKIASLICYEIIFPGIARKFVDKGANVFVTITNDAWFGRTAAPYQHFSMAVFRAVENRVPVIRAANTGISGFIDQKGNILGMTDIFIQAVITKEVSVGSGDKSFYTKYGDLFAFFCIISSVILAANRLFPERQKRL